MQFHRPDTVESALQVLQGGAVSLLAGGTDFFPSRAGKTEVEPVLDLSRIAALRGISRQDGLWRIGATTTWTDISRAELPAQFKGLQLAAREVGSIQIQNAGTIAGNICNASPAADGVPPLLALNAQVEVTGASGVRVLPLADFILGVRKTVLAPGELVTAILVPDALDEMSAFLKLGARKYLVISIAMVAANIRLSPQGEVEVLRVAVGSCSAVAQRLSGLEQSLIGLKPGTEEFSQALSKAEMPELSPIDDVRASADYRLDAVRTLVGRVILQAVQERG